MHTSSNTVIFKFRWIFATDEWRIVSGQTFHTISCGSPLICVSFVATPDQWPLLPQNIIMEGLSRHNSSLIGRKNTAKFENYCISRNGHKIKITQPNFMILVSFPFAEYALSNDVKNNTFSSHGTENPSAVPFVWDTRYNVYRAYSSGSAGFYLAPFNR